jgi:hypothetical protein
MAITDAQQAKQIMMKKGGPVHRQQLAKKRKDGKRPGYYGPDAGHAGEMGSQGFGSNYSTSDVDFGGRSGGSDQDFARARSAIDARAAAAREKARLETIERERIKREVEQINKNIEAKAKQKQKLKDFATADGFGIIEEEEDKFQDFFDTDLGKTGKELTDLKNFDKNNDGKIGPLEGLDKLRTDIAKKTLTNSAAQKLGMMQKTLVPSFFMSDAMRTTPPGVTTKGLDEILGVEGRDKKTGVGSMTNPFEVDYSMTQYGLTGKDLTRARDQIDVAMQDTISQADFDKVYGNNPPPKDDGGSSERLPIIPLIKPVEDKEEEEEEPFRLGLAFRADGGRVGLMEGGMPYEGGIMDLESGRQMYFLGKLVKKATRAVKKIVKSPVGKIGLGALMFGGMGGFSGLGSGGFGGFAKKFGFDAIKKKIAGAGIGKLAGLSIGGGLLAGALAGKGYEDEDGDGFDDKTGFSVEEYRKRGAEGKGPIAFRADGGMSDVENDPQYKGWKRVFEVNPEAAEMHPKHREFVKYYQNTERQGKEEGGLMDLKGMEMDFREDGGFVPIGKKERADDVPARLSKNEFVMTADAVRGAGDGNIDKGAQKMYNLMDKLEAENDQPQGLDGARKMFQTSQRLEEVL